MPKLGGFCCCSHCSMIQGPRGRSVWCQPQRPMSLLGAETSRDDPAACIDFCRTATAGHGMCGDSTATWALEQSEALQLWAFSCLPIADPPMSKPVAILHSGASVGNAQMAWRHASFVIPDPPKVKCFFVVHRGIDRLPLSVNMRFQEWEASWLQVC